MSFDRFKERAWYSFDKETLVFEEIKPNIIWNIKSDTHNIINPPKYSEKEKTLARKVSSNLWVKVLCELLKWDEVERKNNKWYDIILPNWNQMEAKTARIRRPAVIRRKQLNALEKDWFYWIVFYRTTDNMDPSYFISKDLEDSESYLLANISIKDIFIFPKEYMNYFYNTFGIKEQKKIPTEILQKTFAYKSANKLFNLNKWDYEKYQVIKDYGEDKINVSSIWYKIEEN